MLTVFGSINLDVSVRTPRLPKPGETVLGADALVSPGGKGANQAHAAMRFGVPTRLYGKVGDDAFAAPALAALRAAGVDTSGVAVAAAQATGVALVSVDAAGDNAIVVAPGANLEARADQVPDAVLADSRVLLLQLEVPTEQSLQLARRAKRLGCRVMLNAAPLHEHVRIDAAAIDVLIVNRIELAQLCAELSIGDAAAVEQATRAARAIGLDVLVTLGAQGSLLAQHDGSTTTARAFDVAVVDTTGAGDTYAGVFAAAVAEGVATPRAMQLASAAAALACTRSGAQLAQPTRADIDAHLAKVNA